MSSEIEETLRVEGGQVLATLIRLTGEFQLAEDALQDAVMSALENWPDKGVPDKPGAWLTTVAKNRALDRIRKESVRPAKEAEATMLSDSQPGVTADDRLRLIFTCCHPALSPGARVALTLRTISGLTTTEIARAFLVAEPTMGQRISRAKRKIAVARIPYRVPADHELPDRLPSVLSVLYLVFTTGHHAPAGDHLARVDLAEEAIRLTRMLAILMPDEPEVNGLLALMLATLARHAARRDEDGRQILLADQDRSQWDKEAIDEAALLVEEALGRHSVGPYQVQAAIACLHGLADSDVTTDWEQIVDLYRILETLTPSAAVRVNRAVAESKVFGPADGLRLLGTVRGVENWHLFWSTRADFHRQLGDVVAAKAAYRRALECEMNAEDRRFLQSRLATVDISADSAVDSATMEEPAPN